MSRFFKESTSGSERATGPQPEQAAASLTAAIDALLGEQKPDGHWCGELEGDSILQSEYILLKWILKQEDDPDLPRVADYLRQQQTEEGCWVQYPGGKPDLSNTTKAYFALKLVGDDPDAPHMLRAKQHIIDLGGAERCDTYSKFYFAQLGQLHFDNVPAVPPELVFLPKFLFFHLDKLSAWSRTMVLPLAILSAHRLVRTIPTDKGIRELFVDPAYRTQAKTFFHPQKISWSNFFVAADKFIKLWQKTRILPLRQLAIKRIEKWIHQRIHPHHNDGLGAIFPPMVYILIAFRCMGYSDDEEHVREATRQLERLKLEDERGIRFQPCFSPVWDSGIAAYALTDAGLDKDHEAMRRAADWLIAKECRTVVGDWINNVAKHVEPSGWFFEYNNMYYPDVDDTVMVGMALKRIGTPESVAAAERGMRWTLAMQNDDGGWAAFDKTKSRPLLEMIPFADHNAIQDPSCPDITGRTLECLGHMGLDKGHSAVSKAVEYIRRTQETEGCWFGRWGVNYIYGTWQAIGGLRRIGVDMDQQWIRRAGQWVKSIQQSDGGFGETANSYIDRSLMGQGPATPSQTAWAIMTLMTIYGRDDDAVQRGIQWLIDHQLPTGSWEETWFTGTGFPKVFYLRYHLYRLYFPLMALARYNSKA